MPNCSAGRLLLLMVIILAMSGVMFLLIVMIGRGRNWGRITMLVLFQLNLSTSILALFQPIELRAVPGVLELAQLILQFAALRFLFQRESSRWFSAKSQIPLDTGL